MLQAGQDTLPTTSGDLLNGGWKLHLPSFFLWGQRLDLGKEPRGARLGARCPLPWKLVLPQQWAPSQASWAYLPGESRMRLPLPPTALQSHQVLNTPALLTGGH